MSDGATLGGGKLALRSDVNAGTDVELRVPAAVAGVKRGSIDV